VVTWCTSDAVEQRYDKEFADAPINKEPAQRHRAAIDVGSVMTIVKIDLDGGQRMTASVTRDGVDELGLQVGSPVVALIKATEVMLGVEAD
jgi:molybdopterin-binding protein